LPLESPSTLLLHSHYRSNNVLESSSREEMPLSNCIQSTFWVAALPILFLCTLSSAYIATRLTRRGRGLQIMAAAAAPLAVVRRCASYCFLNRLMSRTESALHGRHGNGKPNSAKFHGGAVHVCPLKLGTAGISELSKRAHSEPYTTIKPFDTKDA
jgi:hypothetical protein